MTPYAAMLGGIVGGIGLVLVLLSLKNIRHFYCPNWILRALGETPWAAGLGRHMRAVPNAGLQPTHEVYFVARQDIAECGLACPKCTTEIAERGDFNRVVRSVVDGNVNEVIKCVGLIDMNDGTKPVPCPAWVAASPNTEHGDELIEGDPPEFYKFSRITAEQALRERYGMEITADGVGVKADPKARPEGAAPSNTIAFPSYTAAVAAAQHAEALRMNLVIADAALAPEPGEDSKPSRPAVHPSADETRIIPFLPDPPKDT
jgi:hypothetical protein